MDQKFLREGGRCGSGINGKKMTGCQRKGRRLQKNSFESVVTKKRTKNRSNRGSNYKRSFSECGEREKSDQLVCRKRKRKGGN